MSELLLFWICGVVVALGYLHLAVRLLVRLTRLLEAREACSRGRAPFSFFSTDGQDC